MRPSVWSSRKTTDGKRRTGVTDTKNKRESDNYNLKPHKYVFRTTYQPGTKSNPNPKPTTKQHAIVNIQLNIVTRPTCPEKFIGYEIMLLHCFLLSFVIVTLPKISTTKSRTNYTYSDDVDLNTKPPRHIVGIFKANKEWISMRK